MHDWALMTDRERVDSVLPDAWDWAIALDPKGDFSELQLASITYQTVIRSASKWDVNRGVPFDVFVRRSLATNLGNARQSDGYVHPAERMLGALNEAGAQ